MAEIGSVQRSHGGEGGGGGKLFLFLEADQRRLLRENRLSLWDSANQHKPGLGAMCTPISIKLTYADGAGTALSEVACNLRVC